MGTRAGSKPEGMCPRRSASSKTCKERGRAYDVLDPSEHFTERERPEKPHSASENMPFPRLCTDPLPNVGACMPRSTSRELLHISLETYAGGIRPFVRQRHVI